MTDKLRCHTRLRAANVPLPETWAAAATVEALRAQLDAHALHAVYVKPRWGSSGAGVLAYRRSGSAEQLTTTARLAGARLFNQKRVITYADRPSIDALLGAVVRDGAVVQRWIPKAGVAAGPFDLRVLVVRGHVTHRVARVGRGPITNLHLDAARLDAEAALAAFGASARDLVDDACLRAAACFPESIALGVDVMMDPQGRPFVLECNAWGDYLPGLLTDGRDSYDVQVQALLDRSAA